MPDRPSTAVLAALAAGLVLLLAVGTTRAARRVGVARPAQLGVWVSAGLAGWLGLTAVLALSGWLPVTGSGPPLAPLLLLTALAGYLWVGTRTTFRRVLAAVPLWAPVAAQVFRCGVEVAFWQLHQEGLAPPQVTFEGRNLDVLAGLSAPLVALGLAAGWVGPRVLIGWNLAGLTLLANAVFTVATSAPGPQHLDWPGEPFAALFTWPVVWVPALFAPTALFLHVISLRQAVRSMAGANRAATRSGLAVLTERYPGAR